MVSNSDLGWSSKRGAFGGTGGQWIPHIEPAKGRVLVVEDDEIIREAIGLVLSEKGYAVAFAENGLEALRYLSTQVLPDVIVLDLRMPVMDGWEFRAIQKDDPRMGLIPVVALSADGSGQAAAISAQAYLRKPVEAKELLATIARVLAAQADSLAAQADETERLASLGRLAAAVGHEINNPLTFVMLNLNQSLERLRPSIQALEESEGSPLAQGLLGEIRDRLVMVADMLVDCQVGGERIRDTVSDLQRLSQRSTGQMRPLNVHKLIEESVAIAWNQIRHRARLVRNFGTLPLVDGDSTALGQVFLNLLVNAAHALPEGHAGDNEIRISTKVETDEAGSEVVVEISDSGAGMSPEVLSHIFEPFFTTKPTGQGTGLGLSISRQTVALHDGRIAVESAVGKGTVFRVYLPVGHLSMPPQPAIAKPNSESPMLRGRVLVIDDEPMIANVIQLALSDQHEVAVVDRASDALALFERGKTFDLILCDIMMPDLSGPTLYATMVRRWPQLAPRIVFMTGGAFTPETEVFVKSFPSRILSKPFTVERLLQLARDSVSPK